MASDFPAAILTARRQWCNAFYNGPKKGKGCQGTCVKRPMNKDNGAGGGAGGIEGGRW